MIRMLAAAAVALILLSPLSPTYAQNGPETTSAVQATLYFGLSSPSGGVSEQEWTRFLVDEVTPRFPNGLTVLSAYGQSSSQARLEDAPVPVLSETTKVLIIVHPDTDEANQALAELKEIYKERFQQTGVFHTEQAVEIVD